jgi:hypothetical protein
MHKFVKRHVSVRRSLLIAFLAMVVFGASLQAKLGLYYPETSSAGITSKVIKLIECRKDRVAPDLAVEPILIPAIPAPRIERSRLAETPVAPATAPISESHWFRPPPSQS